MSSIILDEAAEKAKKEKEKTKPPSRIPGLRDASKKMSKIVRENSENKQYLIANKRIQFSAKRPLALCSNIAESND